MAVCLARRRVSVCRYLSKSIFFANLVVLVLTKPQVRVGIVPIFDGRSTQEPITFTFTAAPPTTAGPTAAYPVKYQNELPTLIPAGYQTVLTDPNSSKKNIFVNQWQQSPYQAVTNAPTKPRTTPIYNQAQYYKAIQDGLISFQSAETVTTESPYKAMWAQIADSWQQVSIPYFFGLMNLEIFEVYLVLLTRRTTANSTRDAEVFRSPEK
ncbi:unnamed protein product [Nippostrongylus brasiliensis]|uniref:KRE9 domain-containing protein n=1 Tax=Nippostrongylus brasiliensis TaxID=27835 RepID=A0A0N4XV00_NIPBR|nr:unnamed protein product [Nippostrongylus brasiliensis]